MLRRAPRVWQAGSRGRGAARQMAAVAQLLLPPWARKCLLSQPGCKQSLKAQDHAPRVGRPGTASQGSCPALQRAWAQPEPSSPHWALPAHSRSPMMTLLHSSHTR